MFEILCHSDFMYKFYHQAFNVALKREHKFIHLRTRWSRIFLEFLFFFFFFHWRYSSLWALACRTTSLHFVPSVTNTIFSYSVFNKTTNQKHNQFKICFVAYTPLNMLRALLCPSSGAPSNCLCSLWLPIILKDNVFVNN
jgi:hypothetical protein